jgi:hypothetical protein
MLESIQKLANWMSGLALVPKIATTVILLLIGFVVMYLVWVPAQKTSPADEPAVKEAYNRMLKVSLKSHVSSNR